MARGAGIKTTGESIFGRGAFLDEQFAVAIEDENMHGPVPEATGMHGRPGRLTNDPVLLVYDVENFVGHSATVVSFASGFQFWYGSRVRAMKYFVQLKIRRPLLSGIVLAGLVTSLWSGMPYAFALTWRFLIDHVLTIGRATINRGVLAFRTTDDGPPLPEGEGWGEGEPTFQQIQA